MCTTFSSVRASDYCLNYLDFLSLSMFLLKMNAHFLHNTRSLQKERVLPIHRVYSQLREKFLEKYVHKHVSLLENFCHIMSSCHCVKDLFVFIYNALFALCIY